MSANTAELILILKAQNLADSEFNKMKASLSGVATKASSVAADMVSAFKGIGRRIANQMGNLAVDILSGGSIETSLKNMGAIMAGAAAEGLAVNVVPKILAKIGATTFWSKVTTVLSTVGKSLGGVLAAAIPIGMAALPALLLAAVTAAVVYAVTQITQGPGGKQKGGRGRAQAPAGSREGGPDDGHSAVGGWVGLRGPETRLVGENGPEFIRRAGTGQGGPGGGQGFTIQGISETDILDMVDRGLYFKLQRAAPTLGRS